MALTQVNGQQVAAVVTHLEMTERPKPRAVLSSPLRLRRWIEPDIAKYRTLFRRVGEPCLWFSRLVIDDEALSSIIGDGKVEIYAVCDPKGIEVGLLELDFRQPGLCTIGFLGLVPELAGQGFGKWFLAQALMLGWRKGVNKLTVQTCTLDHPAALPSYRKAGFIPVRRTIETFDDPRIFGLLPRDAAPHIPVLG